MTSRRFPPPWDIEEHNRSCFIVRDNNGQALAYVYFETEPERRTAPICSRVMKRGGLRRKLPSCRTCYGRFSLPLRIAPYIGPVRVFSAPTR